MMFANYRNAIFLLFFVAAVAARGADIPCPNSEFCNAMNKDKYNICFRCGYPLPVPTEENVVGVIINFEGLDPETVPTATNIRATFTAVINEKGKLKASSNPYRYKDLKHAFYKARTDEQQLVLVGNISVYGDTVSVSAEVFDVETGHMLVCRYAYIAPSPGVDNTVEYYRERLGEFAAALADGLPYRGRYLETNAAPPTFKFDHDLDPEAGGRIEIFQSYSYPYRKFYNEPKEKAIPDYWLDLTSVKPKLVTDSFEIHEEEPRLIKITETGRLQFGLNDICYYYPPPELKEIPKHWFVYVAGGFLWHSYDYLETGESGYGGERAASLEVGGGHRFKTLGSDKWYSFHPELNVGLTVDAPLMYEYDYGQIYKGDGQIKGAYVESLKLGVDLVKPLLAGWLAPKIGLETAYYFSFESGVYEHGDEWERYSSGLWNGFLLGLRAGVGVSLGRRKKFQLMVEGRHLRPTPIEDYPTHFGPLWGASGGIRYYF